MQTEVNETGGSSGRSPSRLENEELAEAKQKAARKISKNMKIKGFRPGKAPLSVVERMAGADYVRSEAIEEAIQDPSCPPPSTRQASNPSRPERLRDPR